MAYFYCPDLVNIGDLQELSQEESQHAAKTLRLKVGQMVHLLDGYGRTAEAVLTEVPPRRGSVFCRIENIAASPEADFRINLILASPRNNLCGQIVRQATELGVNGIYLIDAEYSVARLKESVVEKLHRDAVAAMKQSGNAFLPKVHQPVAFTDALKSLQGKHFYGAVPSDPHLVGQLPKQGLINLWIGPEGGFSNDEISALQKQGAQGICLGRWILRVETAVTALLGALQIRN